jgi:uncharacterized protein (TIGR03435 family)
LSAAGLVALALPVLFGLLNSTQSRAQSLAGNTAMAAPGYVSASIKPNQSDKNMVRLLFTPDGFSATGITLQTLIREAYGVQDNQISGAPDWVNTQRYDIEAKRDKSVANELRALGPDQGKLVMQGMLQSLLADRFKLTLHLANKDLQQYSLVVAENGPKLQQSKPEDTYPNEIKGPDGHGHPGLMQMDIGMGRLRAQGLSTSALASLLSRQLGSTVLDKTGLTGSYDFTLQWKPDANEIAVANGMQGTDNPPPPEASGPSIFSAVQEQLGLELKSQTGPVGILVIDHVEMPSEN